MFVAFFYMFNKKHNAFFSGFLIGVFWFWWVGLSFRYYDLTFLIPVVDLFIGVFYGVLFWLIFKIYSFVKEKNEIFAKILLLLFFTFGFDYMAPFTFDWLKPEILFVNTIFSIKKITIFLVLSSIIFYKELKIFSLILLVVALFFKTPYQNPPKLDIYVASTNVSQDKKWQKEYIPIEIKNNFKIINRAIKQKKDVVILPESAFAMFLNRYENLVNKLKLLSKKIVIITGGLHLKDGKFYNSTYIFENGNMKIIDKHILVPFGEYIPLPFFQKEINEIFFSGASDYSTAKTFGEFSIKNYKFINAICYEATVEHLYKLKPHFIVALSNDAWFMPSIMPSLQQMIIKIYAKRYGKIVYHSINGFRSYVVGSQKVKNVK
jgi:apolipoprotein N-acyltransferase